MGLSLREVARLVGVSASTISQIETSNHIPKENALKTLISVLEMDLSESLQQVARQKYASSPFEEAALSRNLSILNIPVVGKISSADLVQLPRWGGEGYTPGKGFDFEPLPVREGEENMYGLTVDCNSLEPVFHHGDYLFASPEKELKSGKIAVVGYNSETVVLKKVVIQEEIILLLSLNPAYQPVITNISRIDYIHPIVFHRLA